MESDFDIFALERKARLASERSVEARAGLKRKSKNIVRPKIGGVGVHLHAANLASSWVEVLGLRWVS